MRIILSVAIFFFKTVYFSPANNPACLVLIVLAAFLALGASLGKHELLALMFAAACAHALMPALRNGRKAAETRPDAEAVSSLLMLPVSRRTVISGALVSALLYFAFFQTAFGALMVPMESLPGFIDEPEKLVRMVGFGEIEVRYTGPVSAPGARNLVSDLTVCAEPSMLFGSLPGARGWPMWIGAAFLLIFLGDFASYYRRLLLLSDRVLDYALSGISLVGAVFFGALIAADVALPSMMQYRMSVVAAEYRPELMAGLGLWTGAALLRIFRLWHGAQGR